MAFQQFDIVPSQAPVTARVEASPVRSASIAEASAPKRRTPGRLAGLAMAAAAILIVGYSVTQAMESLALGVLAADFAFLGVAAAWTAVSGR